MTKAAGVLIPALSRFDVGLSRAGFTGRTWVDVRTLIGANNEFIAVLHDLNAKSVTAEFMVPRNSAVWPVSLEGTFEALSAKISHDLGLPLNSVLV